MLDRTVYPFRGHLVPFFYPSTCKAARMTSDEPSVGTDGALGASVRRCYQLWKMRHVLRTSAQAVDGTFRMQVPGHYPSREHSDLRLR